MHIVVCICSKFFFWVQTKMSWRSLLTGAQGTYSPSLQFGSPNQLPQVALPHQALPGTVRPQTDLPLNPHLSKLPVGHSAPRSCRRICPHRPQAPLPWALNLEIPIWQSFIPLPKNSVTSCTTGPTWGAGRGATSAAKRPGSSGGGGRRLPCAGLTHGGGGGSGFEMTGTMPTACQTHSAQCIAMVLPS